MLLEALRGSDTHDGGRSDIVEIFLILQGLGVDLEGFLLPPTDAEADQQVDNLIALLLQLRGDDLPPFDLARHISEETATDAA